MYDPRGRYPDYRDDEGGYSPPMKWHEAILAILAAPLIVLLAGIIELLIALSGFYFIAKEAYEKGESPFPILTNIGIILAGLSAIAHLGFGLNISTHSFITLGSYIFIFYFTLAPLSGLFLHFLNLFHPPETQGDRND